MKEDTTEYMSLEREYLKTGITYKGNEILHKLADIKNYPYILLLHIGKLFHMNQFEIVFFSHILNEEECSYHSDPSIFHHELPIPELHQLYDQIVKPSRSSEDEEENHEQWSLVEIKKVYVYLLVIGYSVKYYLNESKAYEEEMKRKYPEFFKQVFNSWVDKYSSKVLRTNPRKINEFYIELFQAEENLENIETDCQYRNYNEIVEELIKVTTEVDGEPLEEPAE